MQSGYKRVGQFDIETILKKVPENIGPCAQLKIGVFTVKVTSQRLRLFKLKGCICASCGLKATHFGLDLPRHEKNPHFNLYAKLPSGKEILFTKDHIYPKSLGGLDRISNYQPMCAKCNAYRGNKINTNDFQFLESGEVYFHGCLVGKSRKGELQSA